MYTRNLYGTSSQVLPLPLQAIAVQQMVEEIKENYNSMQVNFFSQHIYLATKDRDELLLS